MRQTRAKTTDKKESHDCSHFGRVKNLKELKDIGIGQDQVQQCHNTNAHLSNQNLINWPVKWRPTQKSFHQL